VQVVAAVYTRKGEKREIIVRQGSWKSAWPLERNFFSFFCSRAPRSFNMCACFFFLFFYSRPPKTSFNSGHECTWRVGNLYVVDIKQAGMTNEKHRTWKRSNFRYWPFDNAQRGSTCFRAWSVTRPAKTTIKSAERTFVSLYLPIDISRSEKYDDNVIRDSR